MKYVFIGCLWCCFVQWGWTQQIQLSDQETGLPLEGATLVCESPPAFAFTDARGQVDIEAFKGAQRIRVELLGYHPLETTYKALSQEPIQLVPDVLRLDKVVLSASRWLQSSGNVPGRISRLDARQVQFQNPQTAADLLGTSGEVFIQKSQQGGGSPMIRGFSSNRLLYTVDGVRMNTAIFRSGNLQNVISLDPFAMESTEILFGPGAVIYGSDAIGGVMAFQTLQPEFQSTARTQVGGNASVRYASANHEKNGHVDLQLSGNRLSAITSFTVSDFDDLRMGRHGPDEYLRETYVDRMDGQDIVLPNANPRAQISSGYSQLNAMQKIRFRASEQWDLQYGFHYSTTTEYDRYDRLLQIEDEHPRYGEWKYGPQKWMMNLLQATHRGGNRMYDEMAIRVAQQYFEESRINRRFNGFLRNRRREQVFAWSANLDFRRQLKRHTVFYGLESVLNQVNSSGLDEHIFSQEQFPAASRYPNANWSSLSAYVSDQFAVHEKVMVQGGLRFSQFHLTAQFDTTLFPLPFDDARLQHGALNGNLGMVIRPTENWVLSVNGATGFRAPNVDDMGKIFDSEPGNVVVPNSDLRAEYAYNLDLGLARIIGKRLKIDLTGFYTYLDDALVRRDFQLMGQDSIFYEGSLSQVQAVQNAASAHVMGLQAGFELQLPEGFTLSSRINVQEGQEELEAEQAVPSRHAAPWFGMSRITFRKKAWHLALSGMYSGKKTYEQLPPSEQNKPHIYAIDQNGNPWSPAWYTLNFKCMYQFRNGMGVNLGVENITDQRYRPFSSGIAAAGRNFVVSFRSSF